ncbi:hypothetical protein RKD37_004065 [Streptomyces ambofaciens]
MKTSVRVPVGAGLAALLLAAGAVGCSKEDNASESPKMTPAAAVAKAAKNTEEINSLRYRMTGKAPEEGRIKAEAEMQIKPTLAMSMKMTALDQGADGTAEIRLVDKALYIGGGPEAAKEMDGKSWIKFDMSAMGADEELNQLGSASQGRQEPGDRVHLPHRGQGRREGRLRDRRRREDHPLQGHGHPRRPGEVHR